MRAILIVLLAGLASSCGRPGAPAEPGEAGEVVSPGLAASLEVEVTPDGVVLALHVTNTTSRPMELTFPTSQRYDFVVTRASGEEVWRWSEGMAFLQAVSRATLGPGESWDMEAVWEPVSGEGELVATGRLMSRDLRAEQSTAFELP